MSSHADRAELLLQARILLDRTAVKVELSPLGCSLDIDYLEHMLLFVGAVQAYLEQEEVAHRAPATIPPVEACGLCGHPRSQCGCKPGADDPDSWPTEPLPADPLVPALPDVLEGRVRE